MNIGERLLLYRRKNKINQNYVAKRLGVSRTTIVSWERGNVRIHKKNRETIENFLKEG